MITRISLSLHLTVPSDLLLIPLPLLVILLLAPPLLSWCATAARSPGGYGPDGGGRDFAGHRFQLLQAEEGKYTVTPGKYY